MRFEDNLEEAIKKKLNFTAGAELHDRMLDDVLNAKEKSKRTMSAIIKPRIGRIIMKNPITKLTAAAVIIVAVILGLFEFVSDESKSGVAWAQVVKNVEASRGVIFRARDTGSRDPNDDWPNSYRIFWRSPTVSRMDIYRDGQIHRTIYLDYDAKTTIAVFHDAKKYSKVATNDQTARADKGWSDPQGLLNLGLSLEHHALGQKSIDGVLCEGIEGTGPDGFIGRVWVGVETGYPILVEIEGIDGSTGTMDQFRWNVGLLAEDVEPKIPADYEPL